MIKNVRIFTAICHPAYVNVVFSAFPMLVGTASWLGEVNIRVNRRKRGLVEIINPLVLQSRLSPHHRHPAPLHPLSSTLIHSQPSKKTSQTDGSRGDG